MSVQDELSHSGQAERPYSYTISPKAFSLVMDHLVNAISPRVYLSDDVTAMYKEALELSKKHSAQAYEVLKTEVGR